MTVLNDSDSPIFSLIENLGNLVILRSAGLTLLRRNLMRQPLKSPLKTMTVMKIATLKSRVKLPLILGSNDLNNLERKENGDQLLDSHLLMLLPDE